MALASEVSWNARFHYSLLPGPQPTGDSESVVPGWGPGICIFSQTIMESLSRRTLENAALDNGTLPKDGGGGDRSWEGEGTCPGPGVSKSWGWPQNLHSLIRPQATSGQQKLVSGCQGAISTLPTPDIEQPESREAQAVVTPGGASWTCWSAWAQAASCSSRSPLDEPFLQGLPPGARFQPKALQTTGSPPGPTRGRSRPPLV